MSKNILEQEALEFHKQGKAGKIEINATKPLTSQRDLSLAYSPGVGYPCLAIKENPDYAYDYTAKGNFVAVISNGTAVLGLGNLGALASKPVMEGKSVLFKRFADIDSIDLEVDTQNPEEFINAIKYLGPSWGGINLEDIKAPECFIIEEKLKQLMDIPVFHDDQHGTAIITLAGLINAAYLTNRQFKDLKIVVNGAGAAAISCIELVKAKGVLSDNVILCDTKGVIYKGRTDGMNPWKERHAIDTKLRTLEEAIRGADVFLGLSVKGALTKEMIASMGKNPIIFAMANPEPEIMPESVAEVRSDAIVATGRSDYNNQVNNVMGFPYIFRGALDIRAKEINDEMKLAAAEAIAKLAREAVPQEVMSAYGNKKMAFGPEYIIPVPFDPRLIYTIPPAVAKAAMDTGVARKPIKDFEQYKLELSARLDPTANYMSLIFKNAAEKKSTIIFSEGEEVPIIHAAHNWQNMGYGKSILIGRESHIYEKFESLGINKDEIKIVNAEKCHKNEEYIDYVYKKLQRKGYLRRDCARLVKNDRNFFAASMLACGDGDAIITGFTRSYTSSLDTIMRIIDAKKSSKPFGLSLLITKDNRSVFIADTTVNEFPSAEDMAEIAIQSAAKAKQLGHVPRVAFLSFSNFGSPETFKRADRMREAVKILESKNVDFEFEGEMSADVALNYELMKLYPFSRLSGPANILIMPALNSANISSNLLQELGGGTIIGPILCGLEKPVQIVQMGSSVSEVLNLTAIASADVCKK